MAEHYMNPKYGELMSGASEGAEKGEKPVHKPGHKGGGHAAHPHVAIHSHAGGHVVHITHPDGRHESHEHELNDAEGIASHIHTHFGGGEGSAPEGHEAGSMAEALPGER